jgi:hypothetical protein
MRKKRRYVTYYEYPLFAYHAGCPTARYVGGTSIYLCECKQPHHCKGWQAAKEAGATPSRM